jgi:hypothetical protein
MTVKAFGDWQVVARKVHDPISHLIGIVARLVLPLPEAPRQWSAVTWTIRHTQTGEVRTVTAHSEDEAALRIAAGAFDES